MKAKTALARQKQKRTSRSPLPSRRAIAKIASRTHPYDVGDQEPNLSFILTGQRITDPERPHLDLHWGWTAEGKNGKEASDSQGFYMAAMLRYCATTIENNARKKAANRWERVSIDARNLRAEAQVAWNRWVEGVRQLVELGGWDYAAASLGVRREELQFARSTRPMVLVERPELGKLPAVLTEQTVG